MTQKIVTLLIVLTIVFVKVPAQTIKGTYAIKNKATGLLLRPLNASKADGAPIVMYSPTNWKCLTWEFNHIEGNTYHLKNLFSSKTFHPKGGKLDKGVPLEQVAFQTSTSYDKWEFIEVDKGHYQIRLAGTELYLSPESKTGKVNTPVILTTFSDDDVLLWTIYVQDPSF